MCQLPRIAMVVVELVGFLGGNLSGCKIGALRREIIGDFYSTCVRLQNWNFSNIHMYGKYIFSYVWKISAKYNLKFEYIHVYDSYQVNFNVMVIN